MEQCTDITINGKYVLVFNAPPCEPGITAYLEVQFQNFTLKGKAPMAFQLPVDKMIKVQVSYTDKKGNPAQVDLASMVWGSSDQNIVTATEDPDDPTTAVVAGASTLGNAQVNVTADADLGEGVRNLVTTMDVTVIAGEAVAGSIQPIGEPVPQAQRR